MPISRPRHPQTSDREGRRCSTPEQLGWRVVISAGMLRGGGCFCPRSQGMDASWACTPRHEFPKTTRDRFASRWTPVRIDLMPSRSNEMKNNDQSCQREHDCGHDRRRVKAVDRRCDELRRCSVGLRRRHAEHAVWLAVRRVQPRSNVAEGCYPQANSLRDVHKAGIGGAKCCVDRCNLVTASDIARRIQRSRQLVHQYMTGQRDPGRFPPPECHLTDHAPLWRWCAWVIGLCRTTCCVGRKLEC